MRVEYTRPNIYYCAGVKLVPGFNEVPADKVAAFAAHPAVIARIAAGVIIPLDAPRAEPVPPPATEGQGEGKTPKPPKPEKASAPTAAQLIEEIGITFDPIRLNELAGDNRTKVASAATARLKALKDADTATGSNSDGDSAGN